MNNIVISKDVIGLIVKPFMQSMNYSKAFQDLKASFKNVCPLNVSSHRIHLRVLKTLPRSAKCLKTILGISEHTKKLYWTENIAVLSASNQTASRAAPSIIILTHYVYSTLPERLIYRFMACNTAFS